MTFEKSIDNEALRGLFERLNAQMDIEAALLEPFTSLCGRGVSLSLGDHLYREGEDVSEIFIVESGFLVAGNFLQDGKRFLSRIYQRGDVVGLSDTNWNYATQSVVACTPCRLLAVKKDAQYRLLAHSPRLGALWFGMAMLDQVLIADNARANARLQAPARIAHLLLQVAHRQWLNTGERARGRLHLPIRQLDLADLLGLTPVYLSTTLKRLAQSGMIARDGRQDYILRDEAALTALAHYENRYEIVSREWLKEIAA